MYICDIKKFIIFNLPVNMPSKVNTIESVVASLQPTTTPFFSSMTVHFAKYFHNTITSAMISFLAYKV